VALETARRYAVIVAALRRESVLAGRSKSDLWVAAWAVQHGAPLATRNTKHFAGIPGLELIEYEAR
jgi:predicted nucleic acid-binding protein